MRPSKAQAKNFLNNELRLRAIARGLQPIPAQAAVNMADIAKVKLKHATPRQPQ